jgi:hypothetical protein
MKKTITIALLAAVSAMFVAGFVSTLVPQANAATSASSLSLKDIGETSASSGGQTSAGTASGLLSFCVDRAVGLGSCADAD